MAFFGFLCLCLCLSVFVSVCLCLHLCLSVCLSHSRTTHLHPKNSVSDGAPAAPVPTCPDDGDKLPSPLLPTRVPPDPCCLCRRRRKTTLRMGATPVPGPTMMSGWLGDCGSLKVPGRMEIGTWTVTPQNADNRAGQNIVCPETATERQAYLAKWLRI